MTRVKATNTSVFITVKSKQIDAATETPPVREAVSSTQLKRSPRSPRMSSRYVSAHMGEPCTIDALDHLLTCGHKVVTMAPEACASNCRQTHSSDVNPRSLDKPFVCIACITNELQSKHAERVASFTKELEKVAEVTHRANPRQWISQKIAVMNIAWRDMEVQEMQANAEMGRFCHAIYVDSDHQGLVDVVVRRRGRFPT